MPLASMTRSDCAALDAADVLAPLRKRFEIPAGIVYLDGNSLGPLPTEAVTRVSHVVEREWGNGLVGSWNGASWIDLPGRIGDKIGRVLGAGRAEVLVTDSTSVNLYKALCVALDLAAFAQCRPDRPR